MEKRNKNNLIIIIAALGLVIIFLVIILFNINNKPKYSWYEDYRNNKDQPYSATILYSLLKTHSSGKNFEVIDNHLWEELPKIKDASSNYFFIGNSLYLDPDDADALVDFVSRGNSAFIITNSIPQTLVTPIGLDDCEYWEGFGYVLKPTIKLSLTLADIEADSGYSFKYVFREKILPYEWKYFYSTYQSCDGSTVYYPLGKIFSTEYINFIKIPIGDGQLFIHSAPMAFSNLSLLEEPGFEYVSKALGYLPQGDIYWDEFSKIPSYASVNRESNNQAQSPLSYILGETSLRWSWYILLALMLLFIIFRSKRKQRVIKVVEPNINTSLEFVETIGTLYYQQNDHKKLIEQKMKYFLAFIRSRYQLNTSNINEDLVSQIARRAEIDKSKVQKIINLYMAADSMSGVSDELLTDLHYSLNYFYKNCK